MGDKSAKRGDLGMSRWHSDTGYIESEDEPWHSTCRPRTLALDKALATESFNKALPYVPPEEALVMALTKVKTLEDIDKAIETCLADGGRPGCSALESAEKIKKAAEKDGTVKPGKAPKPPPTQGAGWDKVGERSVAKTHHNSV